MDAYFELRATLSEYPGNHERELTQWVFGAEWDFMPGGFQAYDRPHAEAMTWAYDTIDGYDGTLEMFPHEEYGLIWQTIDGNDVIWRLAEQPTPVQWEALLGAFKTFPGKTAMSLDDTLAKVESVKLTKIVTTRIVLQTDDLA